MDYISRNKGLKIRSNLNDKLPKRSVDPDKINEVFVKSFR